MSGASDSGFRPEIQGLRAIAVLLVLVFHLWPRAAPGGYVGVDVFFVISGYLMTGLLVREAERSHSISLPRFYARRIRRLLPAASVSHVLIGLAAMVVLPIVRWQDTAAEITASACYVQNWWLAAESVDYLALGEAPSPVQHFWSLSVEEQFYIVWPLIIIAVVWLGRRTGWPLRRLLVASLGVLTAGSVAWSIITTLDTPAPAYFSSAARFWELGLGGLLVLAPPAVDRGSRLFAWAGLVAIAAAALLFSTETAFPGYAALLPTVGTAAVILADRGGGPLTLRPLQYVGGISYSLYLWHWPLIVFYRLRGGEPGVVGGLAISAAAIVLAHFSKVMIEDPARSAPGLQRRLWRSYALGGSAAAASVAVALVLFLRVASATGGAASDAPSRDYPGAAALLPGARFPARPVRPTPLMAARERGVAHGAGKNKRCIQDSAGTDVLTCEYGPTRGKVTIALVGDSHAEHWVPAFEELARARGWHVVAYLKDSCLIADATVYYSGFGREYTECDVWKRSVERLLIETRPTVVVVSQAQRHRTSGGVSAQASIEPLAKALRATWHRLAAAGLHVAVIGHTPRQSEKILECMSQPDVKVADCSARREEAVKPAALTVASRDNPDVTVIDMTDQFCPGRLCLAAIGNVLVYRDSNHITAAYARTLAPALGDRLAARFPQLGQRRP